jgi:hypothetical protein
MPTKTKPKKDLLEKADIEIARLRAKALEPKSNHEKIRGWELRDFRETNLGIARVAFVIIQQQEAGMR